MEGGNVVSEANGITHSPTGEQDAEKGANQTDAAETLPWMDSALGVHAGIRNVNLRKIENMPHWSLNPALVLRRSQPPYWVADEVRKRKKRTMSA